MKRDFELVRKILLASEEQDASRNPPITPKGYPIAEIRYHIKIMIDGGLIIERQHPELDPSMRTFDGMTWEGHEFLDSIREQSFWTEVQKTIKEKGLPTTAETIKAVVNLFVTAQLTG